MKANTRNTPNNNLKQLKRANTTLIQLTEDEPKLMQKPNKRNGHVGQGLQK